MTTGLEWNMKVSEKDSKNLVVEATGVGKTVISAFDYKNFKNNNKGKVNRLLFIAHREDILMQSMKTFRTILRDRNFGGLYTGNFTPDNIDHVFMTIQTFNSKKFDENISKDFYDLPQLQKEWMEKMY